MAKIGFIGCGKMASAILQGVAKSGKFQGQPLLLSSRNQVRAAELAAHCGAEAAESNQALAVAADVIVVCVKPDDVGSVLGELKEALTGKLVVSIAAGLPISRLRQFAGNGARIIRVMPNTPALVHRGATAFSRSAEVLDEDAELVNELFGSVGRVFEVPESALDAVTGLSGSGPAYIYTVIEALADGGVLMGLPRALALELAAQTVVGAGEMVLQTQMHPAELRDMVSSPGGTTIAAIEALEEGGLRAALIGAVRAATEKSLVLRDIK